MLDQIDRAITAIHAFKTSVADTARARGEVFRQKFQFSLAIGNAAGLVYVVTTMTAEKPILNWQDVLPSAWLFVLGATAGSALLLVKSQTDAMTWNAYQAGFLAEHAEFVDKAREQNNLPGTEMRHLEEARTIERESRVWASRYKVTALVLESLAGAFFAGGVLYPLVLLTAKSWA